MKLKKPIFWDNQKLSFWSIILFPFSIMYLLSVWIIRQISLLKAFKKPPIPVICIGNIYLGGTGKTPLAREIFKITKSLGKNPAFIKKYHDYLIDEIKMLNDTGKIFTGHNRLESIFLSFSENYDVAIMDDGFQDHTIRPNFSVLCFNSKQMIGNGLLIPSGPLREKIQSILRSNCIMINGIKNLEFEKKLHKIIGNRNIFIFYSKYKIKNIEKFRNKEITAFAGIGNPSNFFDLLKENNLDIKKTYSFPDHHHYKEEDFKKIINDKSTQIITTEKDFYRLNEAQKQSCDYVEVELEIENVEDFKKIIKSYI